MWFLVSKGDEEQKAACLTTRAITLLMPFPPERSDYPRKMNYGFSKTSHEFVLLGADDIEFRPGWWQEALRVAEETGVGVIGTNDMANRQVMRGLFSTHPLVRRSYVEEQGASLDGPGILVSEAYDHNWCDIELAELAKSRGEWAFARDAIIAHRHPLWRTAEDDDTYRKGRENERDDRRIFHERQQCWQGDLRRRRVGGRR